MDECSMMFFAGPDSVFGDNEFWGGGREEDGMITAPLLICRTVPGRAPCGKTAEMTNRCDVPGR